MKVYRTVWSLLCGTVVAASIAAACVSWTPGGVVLAYVMATLTIGFALMALPGAAGPGSIDLRKACSFVRTSAPLGAAALVVIAMFDMTGLMAAPLFVVAGATSPHLIGWVAGLIRSTSRGRRWVLRTSSPAEHEAAWEQLVRGEVARLSDTELCWGWRISYQILSESADPRWHGQVVVVRASYLNELERRYPAQIAAWLASGPLPANGPERYLRTG